MTAGNNLLPTTKDLIGATEDQLTGLLAQLGEAITSSCEQTKHSALEVINTTLGVCHSELSVAVRLRKVLTIQATTYRGSDYTETHYNF